MELMRAVDHIRTCVPGLVLVMLYGSRARGNARPGSDVDLAVLADAPLEPLALFDLRAELEPLLECEVDVIDLWRADDVLRVQVIEHGRVLFERRRTEREQFEMRSLARYARLNEERSEILGDVRRRGSVYG